MHGWTGADTRLHTKVLERGQPHAVHARNGIQAHHASVVQVMVAPAARSPREWLNAHGEGG